MTKETITNFTKKLISKSLKAGMNRREILEKYPDRNITIYDIEKIFNRCNTLKYVTVKGVLKRYCCTCKNLKTYTSEFFVKSKKRKSWINCLCKECSNQKAKNYYIIHPEKSKERKKIANKKYREKNWSEYLIGRRYANLSPEKLEETRRKARKYYLLNKDKIKLQIIKKRN